MPDPTPAKLDLASMDIVADKLRQLRQVFPEVFTETGGEGPAIDFEKLKAVLGEHAELAAAGQERYGLEWPGKRDALKAVQAASLATLIPAPEESVAWETTKNVFIEGDNLEVLKLLQKSYYGKVKMIYIDPPYNTGNDFVYPDNYAESLDTYLRYTGQVDDEGFKTTTNSKDSGRFHSNWLRMMYPRLYVAKNLLREDGVIFVSIDDNEVANLRQLCDQIFGEENFIAQIIWQKKYSTKADSQHVSESHDYILIYAKQSADLALIGLQRTEKQEGIYKNPDNDVRGDWTSDNLLRTEERDYAIYEITAPSGRKHLPPTGSSWRYNRDKMETLVAENRIWFGADGESKPRLKRFRSDVRETVPPQTLWTFSEVGSNDEATKELASLFDSTKSPFSTPKPTRLLRRILEISCRDGDLALDFFAGSGTLAHSRYLLGHPVKFILVQLPFDGGDECSISTIAKERIRRAGAKIRAEWETKETARIAAEAKSGEGKAGDLFTNKESADSSSTIPDPPSLPPDTGFRVFKLAPSNFKRWDGAAAAASKEALEEQLEANLDHIAAGATEESLLFEILLKAGYELTCPLEKLELAGRRVWSVDGGSLFICVEDRIDSALVDAVAERHPVQFICLDRALQGNDPLKVNTLETFRAAQPEIQFRTV